MTHEDGAAFIFSNDGKSGKLQTVYSNQINLIAREQV